MRMITRSSLIAPVLIVFISSSLAYGQSPSAPDPAPEPDFWRQETMTGDWGGAHQIKALAPQHPE